MAKIAETKVVVRVSKLVRDDSERFVPSAEQIATIYQVIAQVLADPTLIIEMDDAE